MTNCLAVSQQCVRAVPQVAARTNMQFFKQNNNKIIAASTSDERKHPGNINHDRKSINRCTGQAVSIIAGDVIEHPLLSYFDDNMYRYMLLDGVHFNKGANEMCVSSIRKVLMESLQKPHA